MIIMYTINIIIIPSLISIMITIIIIIIIIINKLIMYNHAYCQHYH